MQEMYHHVTLQEAKQNPNYWELFSNTPEVESLFNEGKIKEPLNDEKLLEDVEKIKTGQWTMLELSNLNCKRRLYRALRLNMLTQGEMLTAHWLCDAANQLEASEIYQHDIYNSAHYQKGRTLYFIKHCDLLINPAQSLTLESSEIEEISRAKSYFKNCFITEPRFSDKNKGIIYYFDQEANPHIFQMGEDWLNELEITFPSPFTTPKSIELNENQIKKLIKSSKVTISPILSENLQKQHRHIFLDCGFFANDFFCNYLEGIENISKNQQCYFTVNLLKYDEALFFYCLLSNPNFGSENLQAKN